MQSLLTSQLISTRVLGKSQVYQVAEPPSLYIMWKNMMQMQRVRTLSFKGKAQETQGLQVLCHHHAGRPSECYYAV